MFDNQDTVGQVSSGAAIVTVYRGGDVEISVQQSDGSVKQAIVPGWALLALGNLASLSDILDLVRQS